MSHKSYQVNVPVTSDWLGKPLDRFTSGATRKYEVTSAVSDWITLSSDTITNAITINSNSTVHWNIPEGTRITFSTVGDSYYSIDGTGNLTFHPPKRKSKLVVPVILNKYNKLPRAVNSNFKDAKENEIVALKLLRTMVSPEEFRRYLKCGIVVVKGESGLQYQIQRSSHIILVRNFGKEIAKICIYVKDYSIPPTDEVVTKIFMCECDELEVWKKGNITWLRTDGKIQFPVKPHNQDEIKEILRAA